MASRALAARVARLEREVLRALVEDGRYTELARRIVAARERRAEHGEPEPRPLCTDPSHCLGPGERDCLAARIKLGRERAECTRHINEAGAANAETRV